MVVRPIVPLFKAALFGNDAKDAYGDEGAAAAASGRNQSSWHFSGKAILSKNQVCDF